MFSKHLRIVSIEIVPRMSLVSQQRRIYSDISVRKMMPVDYIDLNSKKEEKYGIISKKCSMKGRDCGRFK